MCVSELSNFEADAFRHVDVYAPNEVAAKLLKTFGGFPLDPTLSMLVGDWNDISDAHLVCMRGH